MEQNDLETYDDLLDSDSGAFTDFGDVTSHQTTFTFDDYVEDWLQQYLIWINHKEFNCSIEIVITDHGDPDELITGGLLSSVLRTDKSLGAISKNFQLVIIFNQLLKKITSNFALNCNHLVRIPGEFTKSLNKIIGLDDDIDEEQRIY